MAPAAHALVVIGWNEIVSLPAWSIPRLRAKVDTGARTTAIHVDDVEELPRDRVRFRVVLDRRHPRRSVQVETTVRRRGRVRSSMGHAAPRLFVETTIRIGPVERTIEIGLVDRSDMHFRVILGRTALAGHVLIDCAHRMLVSSRRRRVRRPAHGPG